MMRRLTSGSILRRKVGEEIKWRGDNLTYSLRKWMWFENKVSGSSCKSLRSTLRSTSCSRLLSDSGRACNRFPARLSSRSSRHLLRHSGKNVNLLLLKVRKTKLFVMWCKSSGRVESCERFTWRLCKLKSWETPSPNVQSSVLFERNSCRS